MLFNIYSINAVLECVVLLCFLEEDDLIGFMVERLSLNSLDWFAALAFI